MNDLMDFLKETLLFMFKDSRNYQSEQKCNKKIVLKQQDLCDCIYNNISFQCKSLN